MNHLFLSLLAGGQYITMLLADCTTLFFPPVFMQVKLKAALREFCNPGFSA